MMKGRPIPLPIIATGFLAGLLVSGCAKHADFLEVRDQLLTISKTQEQEQKRMEAMQRRLESLERVREPEISKQPRNDDAGARLQKLEARLARMEEAQAAQAAALKSARDGGRVDTVLEVVGVGEVVEPVFLVGSGRDARGGAQDYGQKAQAENGGGQG